CTDDWVDLNQNDDAFFLKDSFEGRSVPFRFKAPSQFYIGPAVTRYKNLVGYWSLNEGSGTSAADASPAQTEGSVLGAASWGSEKFGGGLIHDGIDDAVSIDPSLLNEVHKSAYSISLWLKPNLEVDTSTKNSFLARGYNNGQNDNYFNDINNFFSRLHDGQKIWTAEDLHIEGDAEFKNAGVGINQNDNYMFLALSTFVVPEDGDYGFRCLRKDDRATIWLDLDKNNQFDLTDKLGGNNNFTKDPVPLVAGDKHLIAIAHAEWGGGSRIEPWIRTPSLPWTKINPADPNQDGFWILDSASPWGNIITPTSLHKNIFQRNGEGLSLAPGNVLNMTHLTSTGTVSAVATTLAPSGAWRHVVGVFSPSEDKVKIYVDGNKSGEADIPFGATPLDIPAINYWRLGGGGGGTIFNDYLTGETDDLRIYDIVLSDSEIASIYNAGLSDLNVPQAAFVSQTIYDEGDSTNGLGVKFDSGILSAKINGAGNSLEQTHVIDLADDRWHHAAVTFGDSPKAFKLYVDGAISGSSQLFGSAILPAHADPPAIGKTIGTAVFNGLGNFKGLLDEFRIYDRGLTQEEVTQVYDGDMINTGVVSLHAIELPQIVTTPATDVFPERATLNANVLSTGGVITVIDEIRDLTFNAGTAPGIVGWYSASDMDGDAKDDLGLTYRNGAVVTSWKDSSGFMRDMVSSSGDPTYSMFGLNGKPVVSFDGDDKIWSNDNYDFLTNSGYTIFSIARYTGGDSERVISSRSTNWLFGYHQNRIGRWYANGWIDYGTTADTQWHMVVGLIEKANNPKAWLWLDGQLRANGSNGSNNTNFSPGQLQFGGYGTGTGETSKCEVAEVMIYKGMLSDKDRQAVEAYLAYKWDLMDTVLAANHPHKSANPFTGITRVYEVNNEGGDDPVVKIYWGETNGVENLTVDANNSANWDQVAVINEGQPVGLGPVSTELSNLEADKRYFFRAHAENIGGSYWSPLHKFFTASDSRLTKYTLDGLVFWLDANDIDGDGESDNILPDQPIGKWTDKSKSGQNATQTVGGFRPIYITSSFDGRPAVRFASGEYLNVGTLRAEVGGVHAFAVAKGGGVAIGADDGSSGWTLDVKPGSRLASYNNESTNIDRVSVGNDPATGYGQFIGDIAEILVFDRFLPEAEVQMVEGYLAHKWEVTDDLVGNSYKVKQDLELYFNFEEVDGSNVYDSSPKNRQGTLINIADADLQVSGQFGSGIRVPGGNSNISLGVNEVPMGSNWTVSAWFTAPLTDTGTLLQHTLVAATSNDRHVVFDAAGDRQLGVYNTLNGFTGSGFTANTLSTGWHHLVAVGDVDNAKTVFYIDGNLVGESSLVAKNNVGVIGNFEAGDERFTEKLDELRIYSRALTTLDVSELYGSGNGDFGGHPYQDGPPSFDNRPKIQLPIMPLAHWSFDENNGTILTDASGNGKTGTLLNFEDPVEARQAGREGLGVKFDGVNDVATIESQTAFGLSASFAVTFWAKTSDLNAHLLRSGQFRVEALDGFVRGRAFIGPALTQGSWKSTDWTPFALDEWYHYALSYDGTKLRLFLNAAEATTAVPTSGILDWEGTDNSLYIGGMPSQSPMTDGVFDDFRVFNRALTIEELDAVYNLRDSALVARYGMDYSYQITATKGPTDFNATNLPQGLAVDYATGIISGRPEATGSFNVQVTVGNPSGIDTGTINLEVLRGRQSISFQQTLAGLRYGAPPIDLNASATSGLPVSFEIVSGSQAVDLNGSRLSIKGPGMVGIRVSQAGNENWYPAKNVLRRIQIGKAELVIKAHNQFRKTGEPNPDLTYDLTGFVNGENNSSLLSPVDITTIANVGSPAGAYKIIPEEVNASNYFFTYLSGVLTVSDKKSQILIFDQNLTNVAADSLPFQLLGNSFDEDGNATLLPLLYQIEDTNIARLRVTAQDNLIAYWKFDENLYNSAKDERGNYNGTLVNLVSTGNGKAWTKGKFDNAISLGTPNGYVHLGGVPLKEEFTISLWVKPEDTSTDGAVILSKDNIVPMQVFRIEQNATDGFVTATFHQDGNASTVKISSSTPILTNDKWTHLALVYSKDANGSLLLYADGNKSSELTGVAISGINLASRLSALYVGDALASMSGKVDDLRVYDSALGDSTIG
ncbi:MAG: putative Ig domain-containing protein, partial [Verrucomicrobia bacterium]|nr:putative Ig domain-containing protein [Verrucomicrobiota bacterium]